MLDMMTGTFILTTGSNSNLVNMTGAFLLMAIPPYPQISQHISFKLAIAQVAMVTLIIQEGYRHLKIVNILRVYQNQ